MGEGENFVKLIWDKELSLYNKNKKLKKNVKSVKRDCFDTQTRGKLVFDETWETCFHEKNPQSYKNIFLNFVFFFASQEIICQIDFKREQGLWAVEPKAPRLKDVAVPQFIKAKKC